MGKLKLLIDRHGERVMFAEADKESVDLLFQLLSLPVATVIKLRRTQPNLVGSLAKLYDSIENLDDRYIQEDKSKDTLLTEAMSYVGSNEGGFVKGLVTYMVMDDLEVKPLSATSILTLLKEYKVMKLMQLCVNFGPNEAAELFVASLESNKVLTKVYLKEIKQGSM